MTNQHNGTPSVVVLVSSNRRRGAEVFGDTLAEGLRRAGWTVAFSALAAADSGPTVGAAPLSHHAPEELPKLDREVVASLRDLVDRARPDVVLANGSSTMQYAVAALRFRRDRPRLVYVSIGEPMWWVRNARHRMLRTAILKGIDRVFSVSSTTARQLVDHLGVPERKLRIAPTGVPRRFFEIGSDETHHERLRVVFIGNLSEEKGPLDALETIALAAETCEIEARFLGDGPLREALERGVHGKGLTDRIEVLGSVSDVAPHLRWADVLLMTSRTEGLPGVPLEAGAAGVPSVVYDAGGSRETVVDGETGAVVPIGDAESAAAALVRLAGDGETLRTMGEAARRHVQARYTLDGAIARYVELLNDEVAAAR